MTTMDDRDHGIECDCIPGLFVLGSVPVFAQMWISRMRVQHPGLTAFDKNNRSDAEYIRLRQGALFVIGRGFCGLLGWGETSKSDVLKCMGRLSHRITEYE